MKKYLFLLLLLGAIIIPINTFALSSEDTYEVKCKTYNLDLSSEKSIFDYLYFTYYDTLEDKENYSYLFSWEQEQDTKSYVFIIYNSSDITFSSRLWSSNKLLRLNTTNTDMFYYSLNTSTNELSNQTGRQWQISTGLGSSKGGILYSSSDIYSNTNGHEFSFTANSSPSDILDSYTDYCNTGGSCNCNVNVDFPFTKEEFYTLLVLVGTIIIMLFFKWTFPMKGGKKL